MNDVQISMSERVTEDEIRLMIMCIEPTLLSTETVLSISSAELHVAQVVAGRRLVRR
jgi:hypothetical protein